MGLGIGADLAAKIADMGRPCDVVEIARKQVEELANSRDLDEDERDALWDWLALYPDAEFLYFSISW